MQRIVIRTLQLVGVAVGLLAAALAVGFLVTSPAQAVPQTVTIDRSLPRVTLNGVELHVRTFGDPGRPVVVVVHGGPGNDARYLLPLAELQDRFFVVFYDQRGSGLSQRVPDAQLTLEAFYADLDAVVDHYRRGRKVRLVGHSWGAMLASAYLGLHPEKVSQAVLAEPGMLTPETAALLMEETNGMMPRPSLDVAGLVTRAALESLHVREPDADARADYFWGVVSASSYEGSPVARYYCGADVGTAHLPSWRFGARVAPALFAAAKDAHGSFQVDFSRGVERFEPKVLFLAGSCSAVIGEAMQRRHLRLFPRAELVVIEGAGHTMFGEKPEASLAAVRRYFDELG